MDEQSPFWTGIVIGVMVSVAADLVYAYIHAFINECRKAGREKCQSQG